MAVPAAAPYHADVIAPEARATQVEITPVTRPEQVTAVANLLQLYLHDFSEMLEIELRDDGRFGARRLPPYWEEPGHRPFLITTGGRLAGFVFARRETRDGAGEVWDVAEFFVARGLRRRGIGRAAAHALWRRLPGAWQVRVLEENPQAKRFWQQAIAAFLGSPVDATKAREHGLTFDVFAFEAAATPRLTLERLNRLGTDAFVEALGHVYEGSPWVARGAAGARPFASVADLHAAMDRVVAEADDARQRGLIRAHPDLAGRAAIDGALTDASAEEQAAAGLDRLTPDEHARFHRLNDAYREAFGFPFVLAVRGLDKEAILASFEERLGNAPDAERERALREVSTIARFRLEELIAP